MGWAQGIGLYDCSYYYLVSMIGIEPIISIEEFDREFYVFLSWKTSIYVILFFCLKYNCYSDSNKNKNKNIND